MKKKRYKQKRKKMNLYYVTNGYFGDTGVHVYVIAENEDRAEELASQKFKEDAKENEEYGSGSYEENYWTDLEVLCEAEDVSKEFVSDVNS
ncbi:hypothetical protein [Bacillus cereus]|uniref:hypothetical protein n=1 Tax=Bacillus cereus TaxID=1396 RepID=UPI00187903A2|nr:hypothetical protein [Bacillus cereus]MBE7099475.1 hypothetical protein [Bacillus cereus]